MGTNCTPHLADLLLYSYEADFIPGLLQKTEINVARSFNYTFRYIYDVLSLIVSTERYILHMQVLLECCYI
jgi:hypothetical protein